jgi:tetratricopeptide (TPR) repeat protein
MKRDSQKKVIVSLGIVLFVVLSSCGWLRKEQVQREQVQNEQTQKEQVQKVQVKKYTEYIDNRAQMEIGAGKFQKALDLCKEIYQAYPQDPNVRSSCIKTLESIKYRGDRAFERNDFKLAEKIYEVLERNWVYFYDFIPSLSFRKNSLEKKIITIRWLYTKEQVSSHLKTGEFRKAIDLCTEIYQRYPQDPNVRRGYISTLESIKTRGDRAFEGSDFALAGCVYDIVLRNVSSMDHLNGSFSFSRESLIARIRNCEKILFENGLKQYRSGNLKQAISLWKSILAFDPENQEIIKAVDIASLQARNLEEAK